MKYVLAVDVEKTGAALTDSCFAVGAAVVEVSTCRVIDTFVRFNFDPAFCPFEPRCLEFWAKNKEVLAKMTIHHPTIASFMAAQQAMIRDFFLFIEEKQRVYSNDLLVVSDTSGFDHESLNAALAGTGGLKQFMPLPYWNGAKKAWSEADTRKVYEDAKEPTWNVREQTVVAPYGVFRSSTSMLHGFLLSKRIMTTSTKPWAVKNRFLSSFPEIGEPPKSHTHMPDDDAVEIAWIVAQMLRMCESPKKRPAIAFTDAENLHKECRYKKLHPECGISFMVAKLSKLLPVGYDDIHRDGIQAEMICSEGKDSEGDVDEERFKAMNLERCAWVTKFGFRDPSVTFDSNQVEISFLVTESKERGKILLAKWSEGIPDKTLVKRHVQNALDLMCEECECTSGLF